MRSPQPARQIITSLPEPKVYVGADDRARDAAAAAGVDPAEVERMLASFFGSSDPTSPVERRVQVLTRLWHEVDALHAAQVPGGRNLWGLVDERDDPFDDRWEGYEFGLHRELLTPELNHDIKALWGTSVIGRAPDRLVTRVLPHAGAWDAFGPAFQFWHRIGLAAFANTEAGPYPEYGLVDIAENYRAELDAMEALGHPVDRQFFEDLTDAAHRLGEPERDPDDERAIRHEVADGLAFEITVSVSGARPRGGARGLSSCVTSSPVTAGHGPPHTSTATSERVGKPTCARPPRRTTARCTPRASRRPSGRRSPLPSPRSTAGSAATPAGF